jgi:hypothetical protein
VSALPVPDRLLQLKSVVAIFDIIPVKPYCYRYPLYRNKGGFPKKNISKKGIMTKIKTGFKYLLLEAGSPVFQLLQQ